MIPLYWALVAANAAAVATLAAGWWAVAIVALVAAAVAPRAARPLLTVPLGCGLGWLALLLRSARADGFTTLRTTLDAILPIPTPGLAGVTLALAIALALGAALVGVAFRRPPRPIDSKPGSA